MGHSKLSDRSVNNFQEVPIQALTIGASRGTDFHTEDLSVISAGGRGGSTLLAAVLDMQAGLRLVKDVQEDGNVTIDLFLLASVSTEEICITTAKGASHPDSEPPL